MLTRWYDIDRELALLDALHRRIGRALEDPWQGSFSPFQELTVMSAAWPRANLYDTGASLTALLQVPGLTEADLQVDVYGDVLTVSGERKTEPPEGYNVHRRERGAQRFTRSFGLPCRVDADKTTARISNGVLTVTMEKHPESKPKQITVSAG
jgi:HSP20 family protein